MNITARDARSCLKAMREIADGAHVTRVIESGYDAPTGASKALHELGWMDRASDYFSYERGPLQDRLPEYNRDQVLTALALCVAVAGNPSK